MGPEVNQERSSLILILLAVGVLALGVLLYLRSEENHNLELDKQELTVQLKGLKNDLLDQLGQNDSLNSFIKEETKRLSAIIDSINSVNVDNKKSLTNYRYRLSNLRTQNAELVEKLDSANKAYAALKLREQIVVDSLNSAISVNKELSGRNKELSGRNNVLSKTVAEGNELIQKGKQLVIATSTASASRLTASGKERNTKRAKRTDRINICITIAKNKIAEPGERNVYVKLFGPDGKVVDGPENNIAVLAGEMSGYNGMSRVNFQGQAVECCIVASRSMTSPLELEPGVYTASVMTDSYELGKVSIELK